MVPTSARPTAAPPARSSAARERILATAFRLFYARGIRAVGVDTLIAGSGVAKATFYHHFPTKDELVLAYLDHVDTVWTGQLRAAATAAGAHPADQLVGAFDALRFACRREGYRGCAFLNAAAESTAGSPVHARTLAHKESVREWLTELAARGGAAQPAELARTLSVLLDGGLADGALAGDPRAAEAAQSAARTIVEAALGPRRPRSPRAPTAEAATGRTQRA